MPAALVAVVLSIAASALLNIEAAGVAVVGEVPPGLPLLSLPDLTLVSQLWVGALGIALMSLIESIAASRAFAGKDEPPIDANQELVALGFANVGGDRGSRPERGGGRSGCDVLNLEPLKVIRRSPLGEVLTDDSLFLNIEQAVDAYRDR